jgi:hypothetical protein
MNILRTCGMFFGAWVCHGPILRPDYFMDITAFIRLYLGSQTWMRMSTSSARLSKLTQ